MEYLAVGFGRELHTPITVGGGACIADLNFDALLDLSDVQVFINGFIGQTQAGDANGDGIFDLADVRVFIGSFTTCDLL